MKDSKKWGKILGELEKMVRSLLDQSPTKASEEFPPDVIDQLADLEKQMKEFKELNEKANKLLEIDPDKVQKTLEATSPEIMPEEKKLIARAKRLQENILDEREKTIGQAKKMRDVAEKEKKSSKETGKPKKKRERKKKFRAIGGDDKWKRL